MPERKRPAPGAVERRAILIDRAAVDAESRTIDLAFSSETPVERWYGREILDHSPGACRMARMVDGAPLLLNHDPDEHVGAILSAVINTDRVGRAKCKLSRTARGEDTLMDLADGILTKASVGYIVHAMVLESTQDGIETYRVTDWEPIEVSLVPIPADASVGVGRALSTAEVPMDPEDTLNTAETGTATPQPPAAPTPETDTRAASIPVNPEADAIRAVGRHFRMADQAENHIMLGSTLEQFRAFVRTQVPPIVPAVPLAPRIEGRMPHGRLEAYRPEVFGGSLRDAEETAYRAGMWARAVLFNDLQAARWCRDHGVELSTLAADMVSKRVLTGSATGLSVLVPDELVLPIIDLREQYGLARRLCRVHPMASDTATVPRQLSGTTAYFVGREAAPTAGDPSLDNITLMAKNVAAETRISNDFADDSVINLADWVAREHARAFAIKEDECLFNGDGTSTYGGIVGLRVAILGLAGAIDGASGHDTLAEIDATDLRNTMAALPDFPGIDPSWFTSKYGHNKVFGRLNDAASGNNKRDQAQRMPDQWDGYNIVTSTSMPKVATDLSDVAMLLFGDLRLAVLFGDRRGMTMMSDPYSLSSYQQVKIISSERFDINCHGVGTASAAGAVVALVGE